MHLVGVRHRSPVRVVEIVPRNAILAPVQPTTQTDSLPATSQPSLSKTVSVFLTPLFLAIVVTLANATKPVVVDDTAYLAYARHIAENPLDPYGFTIFWYTVPDPAFEVLAPPVVPYWLALGIRLFGEHPALLKLWLFPFVWVFAWALGDLLRRFARGTEARVLPLIVLSPAVLPTVNLMLDVPALAIGLAAVAIFIRAMESGSWQHAIGAGLLAGLAMQTKYTALLIPPAILWYGLTHRRIDLAFCVGALAVAVFVDWELFLIDQYGRSHFVYHAGGQRPEIRPGESELEAWVREKAALTRPLVCQLGCLGIGVGLVAAAALGLPRSVLAVVSGVWATGFAMIVFLPNSVTRFVVSGFWQVVGSFVLVALVGCVLLLAFRWRKKLQVRWNADTLFLVGWVLLEAAGYYILTPFPASRRVIGLVVVGGLLVAGALSRVERIRRDRRPAGWLLGVGIAAGFAVAALDTFDAFPEKWCAEEAAIRASQATIRTADRPLGATVWYLGHWGFQYYCERAGMKPFIPGQSVFSPWDGLVLPIPPDERGFYRPHTGSDVLHLPAGVAEPIDPPIVWDDSISGMTIPNFYGGTYPVLGREQPRLRVLMFRIKKKWAVK